MVVLWGGGAFLMSEVPRYLMEVHAPLHYQSAFFAKVREREFFIDNLLVRIHLIIEMIR